MNRAISIIIPVLNEAQNLRELLPYLRQLPCNCPVEILIIDGGSTDASEEIASANQVPFHVSPKPGRACQMNYAANLASGDILLFIHADVRPPSDGLVEIAEAVARGDSYGCFSYKFTDQNPALRINEFFVRFDWAVVGGGDQCLFFTRAFFEKLGGFDERWCIMEDFELVDRARQHEKISIIKKNALVSARKYEANGWWRVQIANLIVFSMYKLGYTPPHIRRTYHRLLKPSN